MTTLKVPTMGQDLSEEADRLIRWGTGILAKVSEVCDAELFFANQRILKGFAERLSFDENRGTLTIPFAMELYEIKIANEEHNQEWEVFRKRYQEFMLRCARLAGKEENLQHH